jgi:hypothetical protein
MGMVKDGSLPAPYVWEHGGRDWEEQPRELPALPRFAMPTPQPQRRVLGQSIV